MRRIRNAINRGAECALLPMLLSLCVMGTAVSAEPLTEQRLAGKDLSDGYCCNLTLETGGHFKYSFTSDLPANVDSRWSSAQGKWTLTQESLRLSVDPASIKSDSPQGYSGFRQAACKLEADDSSLDVTEFLACHGEKDDQWASPRFSMPDSGVKPGAVRTVDGIKIVMLGNKTGTPTTSLMFRAKPSPSGEVIDIRRISTGAFGNPFMDLPSPALPAGERGQMRVYGRTEQKTKVGQFENYWLYVSLCGNTFGWVFGEFVKITDQK